MKLLFTTFLLLIMATRAYTAELEHISTSELLKTKVLKVITIVDDGFEYTAYEIEYNGIKTTVSPVISLNKYKAVDPIEIMVLKISLNHFANGSATKTMTFTMSPNFTQNKDDDSNSQFAITK